MKIRVVFYKASKDGQKMDDAISFWTGLFPCNWGTKGYSHSEIWFPDAQDDFYHFGRYISSPPPYRGRCFSSTTRGGCKGVRFEDAEVILRNPERWDVTDDIEVADELVVKYMPNIVAQVGKLYDFSGVMGFMIPGSKEDPTKWYCSEICEWVLCLFGLMNKIHRPISPRRLSKFIKKLGIEIRALAQKEN